LNLRNLDRAELVAAVAPFGVPADVAARLFAHVQRDGASRLADGAASAADGAVRGLSKAAARALSEVAEWPDLEILERRRAADGFVKYLFRTPDGHAIEAVRIPLPDPADARALKERRRVGEAAGLEALPTAKYTLCVSSQVGCALACDFCATGRMGGVRSLKTWEILAQHRLVAAEADHAIRGVVFMGMGEPLLNLDNVIAAIHRIAASNMGNLGYRAITVSTVGIVPGIEKLADADLGVHLALSLHAPDDATRARIVPPAKRWPIEQIMEAAKRFQTKTNRIVNIEYCLLADVNDSDDHAVELAKLMQGFRAHVNLIPYNSTEPGISGIQYLRPSNDRMTKFKQILFDAKVVAHFRRTRGDDVSAACGQLRQRLRVVAGSAQ
jgi:23S rRNA (adenine2503-C2)-methyltransferase